MRKANWTQKKDKNRKKSFLDFSNPGPDFSENSAKLEDVWVLMVLAKYKFLLIRRES